MVGYTRRRLSVVKSHWTPFVRINRSTRFLGYDLRNNGFRFSVQRGTHEFMCFYHMLINYNSASNWNFHKFVQWALINEVFRPRSIASIAFASFVRKYDFRIPISRHVNGGKFHINSRPRLQWTYSVTQGRLYHFNHGRVCLFRLFRMKVHVLQCISIVY